MLRRAHAGSNNLEKIVDGNAPFELEPPSGFPIGHQKKYRRGVVLTHGLTDSSYQMRHLASFFQQNGFCVKVVLLPGHGTQPGDLLEVKWQEWAKTVAYGAYQVAEDADEIYLAGCSTGATLSVYHSLRDKRVCGLFLFSPAFKVTRRAAFANLHKLYSWLIPSAKWVEIKPDLDIYKYESFAKNAAAQIYSLIRELNIQLKSRSLDIPIFAAASVDDATVKSSATLDFMARTNDPYSKLVLYTTELEKKPSGFPSEKLEMVDSMVAEQRVLSSAHTAIVIPPEDNHYGEAGEYSSCAHYYPADMGKYEACLHHPEKDYQGEVTEENLKSGVLRRLTYNPHFSELESSMCRFIDSLP